MEKFISLLFILFDQISSSAAASLPEILLRSILFMEMGQTFFRFSKKYGLLHIFLRIIGNFSWERKYDFNAGNIGMSLVIAG
jgi:hypothetical protein